MHVHANNLLDDLISSTNLHDTDVKKKKINNGIFNDKREKELARYSLTIKTKNKELQEFRDQLDKRAQEREEAEAKAKKERERLYALAHQVEKDEKQEKIAETEKIQRKAKKLHEKQRQLSK